MSLTMAKGDGVTVFTLTSDPQSSCPPLCQILKGLCYSPVCCSVSQHLRVQRTSQSVLGALHIMVGLLNIGLAVILLCSNNEWMVIRSPFPFCFGGLFMFFGVMSILSEKFPCPCLVLLNVILSVVGVGLASASIALYTVNMGNLRLYWCYYSPYSDYGQAYPSSSPWKEFNQKKCLEGRDLASMLIRSVNAVLVALSVLELCVAISSGLLGVKALRSVAKGQNKSVDDPELHGALLEEVTSTQTQA